MANLARLPDIVVCRTRERSNRRPRLMTPVWGSLRESFSGSAWYCSQAAMAESAIDGAFTLYSKTDMRLQASGALWKLWRQLHGNKIGGYKYSQNFSDVLWSRYIGALPDTIIISNMQILGEYFLRHYRRLNITPCFFIDGTLTEYLRGYGEVEDFNIDEDVVAHAIEMEREAYQHAARILSMSRATTRNLCEVYGVSPDRVTLVLPGANIDDDAVSVAPDHNGWVGDEFTLGFVGLYPLRKGLDKLAEAVRILRSRGAPIRLRVIGRCPDEIAAMDGVEFLGKISKTTDLARFVEAIRTVDIGCQLSRAELTGIAMMEFLRVGVPIIATNIGGIPDMFEDGGGILVPADICAEQLAEELHALMTDSSRYQELRQAAIRRSEWASWRRVARDIDAALVGIT